MTTRHALVAAPLMPEYDRECGSRRIYDFVQFLLDAGWQVSFVARQAAGGERYQKMLQQRGVGVYVGFDSRVEQLIDAGRLDLAVLAFWDVADELLPMIRRFSPGTPILVDSIDLHFLRNARAIFQRRDNDESPRLLDQRFASEMMRELNVYAAADGVLTVSQKEADLLADFTNNVIPAHVVPLAEDIALSDVPFADRKGILFVGNFRHAPNVSAVRHLCHDILPLVDPDLLSKHPVFIVGNGLTDTVREYGRDLSYVKMVGWVPSLAPYLHHARVMAVPLLYGAGTKGKLVQALMAGTPTVSTTIGIEGLHLENGQQVLVADDPQAFAEGLMELLTDEALWQRFTIEGHRHVAALHGRDVVRKRLTDVVDKTVNRPTKALPAGWLGDASQARPEAYQQLVSKIGQIVTTTLPAAARVLVVSRGDDKLLALEGRRAEHFPQVRAGLYAGHHPATGADAVRHLEELRTRGHEYLLFPATSFWWLEYYTELKQHLDACCQRLWSDPSCIIYRLAAAANCPALAHHEQLISEEILERLRPIVDDRARCRPSHGNGSRKKVLACGIYLANQQNTADHIISVFNESQGYAVSQRWVALFGHGATDRVAQVTVRSVAEKTPKFQLLNELLTAEHLAEYDYVLITDDDIVLPERFLDGFLDLQAELGFALAQPARTSNSYIDHPIVEQQRGVLARQTLFVEIGPLVCFHKSCYELVFPFDLTSPMGWGYENVWSRRLAERGLKMGIIDALPVDHSLRKPVANYSWAEADRQRKTFLASQKHYPLDQCFRVLEAIPFSDVNAPREYEAAAH
jgi:glycosyltransferase involved in cell wall biosynthesis